MSARRWVLYAACWALLFFGFYLSWDFITLRTFPEVPFRVLGTMLVWGIGISILDRIKEEK